MTVGRSPFAALIAALAVLCQLALGQAGQAAPSPALFAIHICGASASQLPGHLPSHPPMDCASCVLCTGLASAALLAPPCPELPPARLACIEQRARPDAGESPPALFMAAAHPRGPPTLT